MGGVDSRATPPFPLACWRDLIREFMYITAAEKEGGRVGGRGGGREGGREGEGERKGVCVWVH